MSVPTSCSNTRSKSVIKWYNCLINELVQQIILYRRQNGLLSRHYIGQLWHVSLIVFQHSTSYMIIHWHIHIVHFLLSLTLNLTLLTLTLFECLANDFHHVSLTETGSDETTHQEGQRSSRTTQHSGAGVGGDGSGRVRHGKGRWWGGQGDAGQGWQVQGWRKQDGAPFPPVSWPTTFATSTSHESATIPTVCCFSFFIVVEKSDPHRLPVPYIYNISRLHFWPCIIFRHLSIFS